MDGNLLCVVALIAAASIFFTKGIMVGICFVIFGWVVIGMAIKSWVGNRQGAIDSKAGLPGGTSLFNLVTIILAIGVTLFY